MDQKACKSEPSRLDHHFRIRYRAAVLQLMLFSATGASLALAQNVDPSAPIRGQARPPRPSLEIVEPHMRPGRHTLTLDVLQSREFGAATYHHSGCGIANHFPGTMRGAIGWGQSEVGLSQPCFSAVMQQAIRFD